MAARTALACLLCIAALGATVHGSTPEVSKAAAAAVLEMSSATLLGSNAQHPERGWARQLLSDVLCAGNSLKHSAAKDHVALP